MAKKYFTFVDRYLPIQFFEEDPVTITVCICDEMDKKIDTLFEELKTETSLERKREILAALVNEDNAKKLLSRCDQVDAYLVDQLLLYIRNAYIEGKKKKLAGRCGWAAGKEIIYSPWHMPNALLIDGDIYPICTDFRAGIEYQIKVAAGSLTATDFYTIWFPGPQPENFEAAFEAVSRFYRRKDEPPPQEDQDRKGPTAYDFAVDADAICAEFQRQYGIDLTTAKMHWWRFMALLDGLYSYSFSERVGFRVADLGGMDAKQRARILKKRSQFAIGREETVAGHLAQLDAIIAKHGGGDCG